MSALGTSDWNSGVITESAFGDHKIIRNKTFEGCSLIK